MKSNETKPSFLELMEAAKLYVEKEKPMVQAPMDISNIMRPIFLNKEQEEMWVLFLNSKNRLLEMNLITVGLVDRSQVHAREVFRKAIVANCSRIVLAHNHPSGEVNPSAQDIECTRQLVEAGKIIGIDVIDHVVMGKKIEGRSDFMSFREQNLI